MVLSDALTSSPQAARKSEVTSAPISDSRLLNIDAGTPVTFEQAIGKETSMVLVFNRQGQLTKRMTYAEDNGLTEERFNP